MSTGGLADDPRRLCVLCARMASWDNRLSEDAAAALADARQLHERAELCHEMRGLLCPLGEAVSVCDAGSRSLRYRVLKRTIDVLGGLIGSAITVVLLPAIAAIVKSQSPGPIFFTQDRVGLDGEAFQLLKFRTMHERTSEEARWVSEEEDRSFGFGAFMRRFHIDEFPQFFNVLRGSMSLVGPRPEQVPNVERLSAKIPNYDKRYCALPGLTNWSQLTTATPAAS